MKAFNQNSATVSLGKRHFEDTRIFHPIHFKATGKGNWYIQDLDYFEEPSFKTDFLPEAVQLKYCFKAKILSDYLLTFKNEAGYIKSLIGLRKTLIPDWYYGDLKSYLEEGTKTSLILIQFSPDRSIFRLFLFDSYYPEGAKRINAINGLIQEMLNTRRPSKLVRETIIQHQAINANQESGIDQPINRLMP